MRHDHQFHMGGYRRKAWLSVLACIAPSAEAALVEADLAAPGDGLVTRANVNGEPPGDAMIRPRVRADARQAGPG
jgi:hypothetical protein